MIENRKQQFFSQREAADYLGISKTTLTKYRRAGYFPETTRTRNTVLYSREMLENFADKYIVIKGKKDPQLQASRTSYGERNN